VQKSVPVKLARLLLDITIGCCFDSHPRIDSVLQNSGFRYGLLENAISRRNSKTERFPVNGPATHPAKAVFSFKLHLLNLIQIAVCDTP
ncbi:MAG: hypothetical protein ACK5GN_08345, partial [Pseudomonadota bacterium]|jgi:hypothetical protein